MALSRYLHDNARFEVDVCIVRSNFGMRCSRVFYKDGSIAFLFELLAV